MLPLVDVHILCVPHFVRRRGAEGSIYGVSYAQAGRQMASTHTHMVMNLPSCMAVVPFSLWPLREKWALVPMNFSEITVNKKTNIYKDLMVFLALDFFRRIKFEVCSDTGSLNCCRMNFTQPLSTVRPTLR